MRYSRTGNWKRIGLRRHNDFAGFGLIWERDGFARHLVSTVVQVPDHSVLDKRMTGW